jgi:nucleosome binding factor SPN SPT16 subunit
VKSTEKSTAINETMSDEIVIEKDVFHDRLSNFLAQWKNDKRSGDTTFQGVNSIVLLVGKASDGAYVKSTAFQVCSAALLGYL